VSVIVAIDVVSACGKGSHVEHPNRLRNWYRSSQGRPRRVCQPPRRKPLGWVLFRRVAKRLALPRAVVPKPKLIGVLVNPKNPNVEAS